MQALQSRIFTWVVTAAIAVALPLSAQISDLEPDPQHHDESEPQRCGTFELLQLLEERGITDPSQLTEKERELKTLMSVAAGRPEMDRNIISRDGHFRIHFDESGTHAPAPVDGNGNGIPDYIDSVDYYMEYAWQVEIDECGWATPPPDNTKPTAGGLDGRIDVYVRDLAREYYGVAWPDENGRIDGRRVPGYLVLDNDYNGYPTPGIEGLKVTSAHEFHHIVQFSAYIYDLSQASLYEATSTLMEFKVHPDVEDYRLYFNDFLKSPQDYPFSKRPEPRTPIGYAHMHYLQSLVQQIDDDIVVDIWDRFKQSTRSYAAIDDALVASNSGFNLSNSFCTFAEWSYHTGSNAADTIFFKEAHRYPTIASAATRQLDPELETIFVDSLSPLAFGLYRLVVPRDPRLDPDTVDFVVTNALGDLGKGGPPISDPEEFTLQVSAKKRDGFAQLLYSSGALYYKLTSPHTDFCVSTYLNGSEGTIVTARPTPQPFVNDGANEMVFSVIVAEETIEAIELDIYSMSMARVGSIRTDRLQTVNNVRGIVWDGRLDDGSLAPSGVYVYTLGINGSTPSVGKFAVVRK